MEKKEYTYICVYEHISGKRCTLVFTGTFHVVYKRLADTALWIVC